MAEAYYKYMFDTIFPLVGMYYNFLRILKISSFKAYNTQYKYNNDNSRKMSTVITMFYCTNKIHISVYGRMCRRVARNFKRGGGVLFKII